VIEIRKALQSFLSALHPRVYFKSAPDTAQFPYVVYNLQIISGGEYQETVLVDIDGWDQNNTGDTTTLEELMKKINALDKASLVTDDLAVTFFKDNMLTVEDTDKSIKRRQNRYTGLLYRR